MRNTTFYPLQRTPLIQSHTSHCGDYTAGSKQKIFCCFSSDFCFPQLCQINLHPLRGDLSLRSKKRVDRKQMRGVRGLRKNCHIIFCAKVAINKCRMSGNITMVKHPFNTASEFRFLPQDTFTQSSQNYKTIKTIGGLTLWKEFMNLLNHSWPLDRFKIS